MKKIISLLFSLLLLFAVGCSDNAVSGNTTGGLGGNTGGGTNTGNVTFTINSQNGQNGGIELLAKPSVDVTINSVNVKVPAENFDETYQGDGVTVFPKDQWVSINEYTGVTSGMKFVITFVGKTSPDKKDFNVSVNYSIP
jgi:hypothetical protein